MWAKLRSFKLDPKNANPCACETSVPFRFSVRSPEHDEHTADSAASSKADTMAKHSDRNFSSRERPIEHEEKQERLRENALRDKYVACMRGEFRFFPKTRTSLLHLHAGKTYIVRPYTAHDSWSQLPSNRER